MGIIVVSHGDMVFLGVHLTLCCAARDFATYPTKQHCLPPRCFLSVGAVLGMGGKAQAVLGKCAVSAPTQRRYSPMGLPQKNSAARKVDPLSNAPDRPARTTVMDRGHDSAPLMGPFTRLADAQTKKRKEGGSLLFGSVLLRSVLTALFCASA